MEFLGNLILYAIMASCALGAVASVINEESELARAFHDGLGVIAALLLPIMGVMVSIPYLIRLVNNVFAKLFSALGADPTMGAAVLIPGDIGGYALFLKTAASPEVMVIATLASIMAAATITITVPVALSLLGKNDHPYLALGAMCGILAVPFGILVTCLILMATSPEIRTTFTTVGPSEYKLNLTFGVIAMNLLPIIIICGVLALLLKLKPRATIKGFMIYGKILLSALTLIAAASIIEYYTGFFGKILGSWGFDPVMADEAESFRAIEAVGAIAMMLTGAFPFLYLIRKFFGAQLAKAGRLVGLDEAGSAGVLAAMANAMAMLGMIKDMRPESKVLCLAFMVCGGYCLGDWIAFMVNFQPNLIVPVFIGQVSGGLIGIFFARMLALPQLVKIETP